MARRSVLVVGSILVASVPAAGDSTRTISREHPAVDIAGSRLAIGRDGRVYLASDHYLVSTDREGHDRRGGASVESLQMAAANADGIVATANAHFQHSVILWSPQFQEIGRVADFLVNDTVQWTAPCEVEAGSSGDFYALDQNRARVVRIAVPGRIRTVYSVPSLASELTGRVAQLRVSERARRFYVLTSRGTLHAVDFDGRASWSLDTGVRNFGLGWQGGFDIDDEGRLYVLGPTESAIRLYDRDAKLAGHVTLRPAPSNEPASDLRAFGPDVFVKRRTPREAFEVYDRASGALRRTVRSDIEEATMALGTDPWTAGVPVPLAVRTTPGVHSAPARWGAWIRPLGTADFLPLPFQDGRVVPSPDAGGLYQLRVTPGLRGGASEYGFDQVVEIRTPGAKGAVWVATPNNRTAFGQGEPIPVSVALRVAGSHEVPDRVRLELVRDGRVIAGEDTPLKPSAASDLRLPPELTRVLSPGGYELTARASGFTSASQRIEIGPGIEHAPEFSVVAYGDYETESPRGSLFDTPDKVAAHLNVARKLGVNMIVERLREDGALDETLVADGLVTRLASDASAVAPGKAAIDGGLRASLAAYGSQGIEYRGILLSMDAGLPLGTGFDPRTPVQLAALITRVASSVREFPAFRGWSWAANWWPQRLGGDAAEGPDEKSAYGVAVAEARATGRWSPILDIVSDRTVGAAVTAERELDAVLQRVAPGTLSVMTGPYRALGVIPPITFQNADEVDLHYQAEQIQPPEVTPHNVDFYKRPGKRAWGHPELWNDDGTGGMVFPTLFQMLMRGVDGVGWSGSPPWYGPRPSDPRSPAPGELSVLRAFGAVVRDYGPWLTTLRPADRVALVVSSRMMRIDTWGKLGGHYFDRLYEAYGACLYAHRPASFVFAEEAKPGAFDSYEAILVVDQRVELDPPLARALAAAQRAGARVYFDGTSRPELLKNFAPLGLTFDRIEHDPSVWQDDAAYARIPEYFRQEAKALQPVFGAVPQAARIDDPDVLVSERKSGQARFVWAVDNVIPRLEPGIAWRTNLLITARWPLAIDLDLGVRSEAVYDVFGLRRVPVARGVVDCDLRSLPARLFAILPGSIGAIEVRAPGVVPAGQPFEWQIAVRDDRGAAIRARLPIRVQLVAEDGRVLREQALATTESGEATGRWTVPVDVPGPSVNLRAFDLVSGRVAGARLRVAAVELPLALSSAPPPAARIAWPVVTTSQGLSGSVRPGTAVEARFGPHFKAIAISPDGANAVVNAMNWDENLIGIDPKDGTVRWRRRFGDHFTYDPRPTSTGFSVEAFDRASAEGYHLSLLDAEGRPERRFALFGVPDRATHWAFGSILVDRIDNFAVSPRGEWIASAGNLGLCVWDRSGRRLWTDAWWKTDRKEVRLAAADAGTLVVADGPQVTAYDARSRARRWSVDLGASVNVAEVIASPSGVIALRTDMRGGRVVALRDGKVLRVIPSPADAVALAAEGDGLALTTGDQLKSYAPDGGLAWSFDGDSALRGPRFSPDGRRIVVGSELGTLTVLSAAGEVLWEHDYGALPAVAWMPDGDLIVATWMGDIERRSASFEARWRTHVVPLERDRRARLNDPDPPTVRVDTWGNASATPAPLTPNLLADTRAIVRAWAGTHPVALENDAALLTDGQAAAPPRPWLPWSEVNLLASGWTGPLRLELDTFRTQLRVTGVTFVEDAAHPESWVRDARLQYWDPPAGAWRDGPLLLANSPVHTHVFTAPLESARFRVVSSGAPGWPSGNLRLGEVVFHGTVLGTSHPDILAKRPVAVLFDENGSELEGFRCSASPASIVYGGAFAGGQAFALSGPGMCGPDWLPPFGHAIRNWDFEIAEHPRPGQYRWLQFAWKALSSKTTGMSVLVGRAWPGGGYAFVAGDQTWHEGVIATDAVAAAPPRDWQVVRVDLWKMGHASPMRIQCLSLVATGDGFAIDDLRLGRTEEDLAGRTRALAKPTAAGEFAPPI